MIYLYDHEVIFLKPRKVAGSSFELVLSKYAGPNCIVTPLSEENIRYEKGYRTAQNHHKPLRDWKRRDFIKYIALQERPMALTGHESAETIKNYLGAETFEKAFKISIVRNPFSVVRSLFFWEHRNLVLCEKTIKNRLEEWAFSAPQKLRWNYDQYFLGKSLCVDFMIKYEQINNSLAELEYKKSFFTNLYSTMVTMNAKRGVTPPSTLRTFYSEIPDVVKLIELLNAEIIEKYDYSLDEE